jgi:hypothetical protein
MYGIHASSYGIKVEKPQIPQREVISVGFGFKN